MLPVADAQVEGFGGQHAGLGSGAGDFVGFGKGQALQDKGVVGGPGQVVGQPF